MITAKDFTKAEEGVLPVEAGLYICLLQSPSASKLAYVFGVYSAKDKTFNADREIKKDAEVIAWLQIESETEVAEKLVKPVQDEENV